MRLLRKLAIVALIVFFGWQAYREYQANQQSPFGLQDYAPAPAPEPRQAQPAASPAPAGAAAEPAVPR